MELKVNNLNENNIKLNNNNYVFYTLTREITFFPALFLKICSVSYPGLTHRQIMKKKSVFKYNISGSPFIFSPQSEFGPRAAYYCRPPVI